MKTRPPINITTDSEIFEKQYDTQDLRNKINSFYLNKNGIRPFLDTSIYMKSSLFILVLNGSSRLHINFKEYVLNTSNIALLSFGHFFTFDAISDDFMCKGLYVSKDYIDEMYSSDMIYKRIKYGVKMYNRPILPLRTPQAELLYKRLGITDEMIDDVEHHFHKDMVLNSLKTFFLDLGNIIEQEQSISQTSSLSRDELIIQAFIELLVDNYKTEHHVEFYANQLHITSHYLTLVIKRLTGQSVSDFIFQMIYNEARLLLQQPKLSIQQISDELNFSDQSSFGKFFKRKSGISPKEFRLHVKTY